MTITRADSDMLQLLQDVLEAIREPYELYDSFKSMEAKDWNARRKLKAALIKLVKAEA